MRVGRLKHQAKLLSSNGNQLVENLFISITEPDTFINFGEGLLSSERTTIRARWQEGDLIQAGNWIKTAQGRLFLIVGFSQPKQRQDMVIGAREAVGYQASIHTSSNPSEDKAVLVALMPYIIKPKEGNQFLPAEERRRVQFASAEHQPAPGQELTVNGQRYRITELDATNSNEQITTAWVVAING